MIQSAIPPPVYDRVIHTGAGRYVLSITCIHDAVNIDMINDIQQARAFHDKIELDHALFDLQLFTGNPQVVLRLPRDPAIQGAPRLTQEQQ